jgi:hypothetical protein
VSRETVERWLGMYLRDGYEVCISSELSCLRELAEALGVQPKRSCPPARITFLTDCSKYYIVIR